MTTEVGTKDIALVATYLEESKTYDLMLLLPSEEDLADTVGEVDPLGLFLVAVMLKFNKDPDWAVALTTEMLEDVPGLDIVDKLDAMLDREARDAVEGRK